MIQNRSQPRKFNINTYSNKHNIKIIKIRASKKKLTNGGFVFFVLLLLVLKSIAIYYTFNLSTITNEYESFHYTTSLIIIAISIKNDLIVFATMLMLKLIANTIKVKLLKFLFNFINLFIILFYVYDSILIYFSNRLYFFDIKKFIMEVPDKNIFIMQIGILMIVFFGLWRIGRINKKVFISKYISLIGVFVALFIMPIQLSSNYAKQNLFSDNIFQTNLELDYIKKNKDAKELSIEYEQRFEYFSGNKSNTNIILLIVESLSSIDSYRNSEIKDYMPKLDLISQDGMLLTNLKANGNTTDGGMVAILQGVETIPYSLNTTIYNNYFNPTSTIPQFFNEIGYKSIFLTTGPLDFLDKGSYLKTIGFEEIIGRDIFPNEKTYTFWSPPDEVLYDYGLSLIKKQTKPFFLNMLTISSHLSYDTPYGKSKEEMYKYVDDKLGDFYNGLKEIDYFDNGILVIVGDHRKMTPLEQGELEKYGIGS
ncbi:MAG: sulfatase-like hydrolase/transferase, partial [Candidatus Absconditabacteria bacterium]